MPRRPFAPSWLEELGRYTPALLFTTNATGRIDYANERWAEVIGTDPEALLRDGWSAFVHPDDMHAIRRDWGAALQTGEPYRGQWRLRRNDGAYRWVEIRAEAERGPDGSIVRWHGAGADIDVQQRAMAAIELLEISGASASSAQDVPAVLECVARAALDGLADVSFFDILEPDGSNSRVIVASADIAAPVGDLIRHFPVPAPTDPHPIARSMRESRTVYVQNVDEAFLTEHILDPARREAWRVIGIHSLITAPMEVSGRRIGALTLLRTTTNNAFEPSDARIVEEIARRAAIATENIRLTEKARSVERTLRVLAELGPILSASLELPATLDAVMRVIVPEFADWAIINLLDEHADLRVTSIYHGDPAAHAILQKAVGKTYSLAARSANALKAMRERRPILYETADVSNAAHIVTPDVLAIFGEVGYTSVIVLPLVVGNVARGTLNVAMNESPRHFRAADLPFFEELARRIAPAIGNAELFERERNVARSFQNAALPATLPEIPNMTFSAIYEAGRAEALVGGDWFDAFELEDGRVVLSIGDVSGSGLRAAVTMATMRQAIRSVAHVHPDPNLMLRAADRELRSENAAPFVTAFVGVLDPVERTIVYRSAGHPPPIVRSADGSTRELKTSGAPLGVREREPDAVFSEPIEPGCTFVLFTDGLIESTHDIDEGYRRLDAVVRSPDFASANDAAQYVHDAVLTEGTRDDVAILCVGFSERVLERRNVNVTDPVAGHAIQTELVALLERFGYPPDAVTIAEVVMAELLGNIVRYAPGNAEFIFELRDERVVLHVLDNGPGYQILPRLPIDLLSESGRGLFLVASIAEAFQVTRRASRGSHARVVFSRSG